jgi:hypothetical protein
VPGAGTLKRPVEEGRPASTWLRPVAPAERLAMVRILVSAYALAWMAGALGGLLGLVDADAARWQPVGLLAPLDAPPTAAIVIALLILAFASGFAFAAGACARLTGPVFATTFVLVTTYRSSWGQIFHTDDLVAIHLVVLAVVPSALAWSWDARRAVAPPAHERFGWPLRLMSIITVTTYVLAGLAKLRTSGLDWVTGTVLRDQIAQDNLLKELFGAPSSPVAGPLLAHAWVFPPMAAFAVAVELGAPVALLGNRWRNAWVAAAWVFHLGILVLMTTFFPYPLSGVAFASMFAVERLPRTIADRWRRRRRTTASV